MKKLSTLGRLSFILSFSLYVGLHFGKSEAGAALVPSYLPAPLIFNYATGACIVGFILSALIGRLDRLSSLMMAFYVILMTLLVHIPRASTSEMDALNVMRNVMVLGALLMYAGAYAKDQWLPWAHPAKA